MTIRVTRIPWPGARRLIRLESIEELNRTDARDALVIHAPLLGPSESAPDDSFQTAAIESGAAAIVVRPIREHDTGTVATDIEHAVTGTGTHDPAQLLLAHLAGKMSADDLGRAAEVIETYFGGT